MEMITADFIKELAERVDLEAKRSVGRGGQGELPRNFFETYSAMANTNGGVVILGIEENPKGTFKSIGILQAEKVIKDLWDGLNNQQRVSYNLLTEDKVNIVEVEGRRVIQVEIPRASRTQRPVYIGTNPMTGTYRRFHEGDYKCDEETVRRMLAERIEQVRDARVLPHHTLLDLDMESFKSYRYQFQGAKPAHPWNTLEIKAFLHKIGGWGRKRDTGEEGLTLAGLLMFGELRSILDQVPYYIVDYQERPEPKGAFRWIDRLTIDGTWSGNLFDFYRRVIRKLTTDIKVPFRLKGDRRKEDTPVHEALREALVNTIIHADYSGRVSILVVKRPDMFGFRNPGTMRIPIENALIGGESDCRNRNLQKMFQLVGLGEQAGSGIPKIYKNWFDQHWFPPRLYEKYEVEQTLLELRMIDLLPEEATRNLDARFGAKYRELSEDQRLALAIAEIDGIVTLSRLKDVSTAHPHDLSNHLSSLTKNGYLESAGTGRGTYYFFSDTPHSKPADLFSEDNEKHKVNAIKAVGGLRRIEPLPASSEHLPASSEHLPASSEHLSPTSEKMQILMSIAADIRKTRKAQRETIENLIVQLCSENFLLLKDLSVLLGRSMDTLRTHYLSKMIKEGRIKLLYPGKPNHPRQKYTTGPHLFDKKK